jgi:teichuronic acid biosynthesis glycosyltransferase TuaC
MHIAFITGNYPTTSRPETGAFVQQFVWAMARQGNECSVINPASVFDRRYGPYPPRRSTEDAGGGSSVSVYRPLYISFSSLDLGWTHTGRWTQSSLNLVARRAASALPSCPDLVYGHFLYNAGRAAVVVGGRLGVSSVIGVGEGTFWTVAPFGFDQARLDFDSTAGFLAVGSHIRDGLIKEISVNPEKIVVEPNGVDRTRFFQSNQRQARAQLGLAPDVFMVAFIGTFDTLKGGAELVAAVDGLDGVGLAMIGQGEKTFESKSIIYTGWVRHDQVAVWLNAADIFVLPTREEGSCNAVIEAMACGLPIVTARGRYMDDIVDDEVAIRVDPTDVRAIRDAILDLKNDAVRRKKMSEACLRKAGRFDINQRARRVTAWMEELVRNHRR